MGVDPVWLGVMIGVNLQTSFLTPPFGFALFYLRGVAGRMLTTLDIYKGVVPFVVLQVVGLCLLWAMPALATYLPDRLFADTALLQEDARGPSITTTPSGSPVADDFSELFDGPAADRPRPYQDNLQDLFPPDEGDGNE
jgi:hypothetical protein